MATLKACSVPGGVVGFEFSDAVGRGVAFLMAVVPWVKDDCAVTERWKGRLGQGSALLAARLWALLLVFAHLLSTLLRLAKLLHLGSEQGLAVLLVGAHLVLQFLLRLAHE